MGISEEKLLAWQGFQTWLQETWLQALTSCGLVTQAADHAQQLLLEHLASHLQRFWSTVQQVNKQRLVGPASLADSSTCTSQQQQELLQALSELRDACQALWSVVQRHTDILQRLCVALYVSATRPAALISPAGHPHSSSPTHQHIDHGGQQPDAAADQAGSGSFTFPGHILEAAGSGVDTSSFSFPSLGGAPLVTPAPPALPTLPGLTSPMASPNLAGWCVAAEGQQAVQPSAPRSDAPGVSGLALYQVVGQYKTAATVLIMRAATCSLPGTLCHTFMSCLICLQQRHEDQDSDTGHTHTVTVNEPDTAGVGVRTPLRHLPPLHQAFHSQSHAGGHVGGEVTLCVTRGAEGQENQPPPDCQGVTKGVSSAGGDGLGPGGLPAVLTHLSALLQLLGLWPACQEAATDSLAGVVHYKCASLTQGLDSQVLPEAWRWVDDVAIRFLHHLLLGQQAGTGHVPLAEGPHVKGGGAGGWGIPCGKPAALAADLQAWRQKLVLLVYQSVGELRLDQMWDVVVEHPDSLPAVQDMAACLAHTSMQARFVSSFRRVVCRRLLHAGASAQDVVHTYVAIIRVLQALDPAGSLLKAVAGPIRVYLQGRPDTVRCIVERVTGAPMAEGADPPTSPSLLEEVQQEELVCSSAGGPAAACPGGGCTEAAVLALLTHQIAGAETEAPGSSSTLLSYTTNQPTATATAGGAATGSTASSADVIDLLVRVFKSPEHFLSEYRSCLARDLLRLMSYDTTRALQTCELLKLRFGDACLHACEVMLKDIADSKRLHTVCTGLAAVAGTGFTAQALPCAPPPQWLSAIISSYLFWPQMGGWGDSAHPQALPGAGTPPAADKDAEAGLVLPTEVATGLQAYGEVFRTAKAPRKLHWKQHLGLVELQVDVGGVVVHAQVSPLLATLLLQFQQHDCLSVQQLSQQLGLPVALIRRRVLFWVESGLLMEVPAEECGSEAGQGTPGGAAAGGGGGLRYQRVTCLPPERHDTLVTDRATLDEACVLAGGAGSSVVEEMSPFEPYLMGILLNTGGLPLDRLHTMLQRFVVSPKYDKSVDQLAAFLSVLVADGKLVLTAGVYKRKPAAAKPSDN